MRTTGQHALLARSGPRDVVEPLAVWSGVVVIGGSFWALLIYTVAALVL